MFENIDSSSEQEHDHKYTNSDESDNKLSPKAKDSKNDILKLLTT